MPSGMLYDTHMNSSSTRLSQALSTGTPAQAAILALDLRDEATHAFEHHAYSLALRATTAALNCAATARHLAAKS